MIGDAILNWRMLTEYTFILKFRQKEKKLLTEKELHLNFKEEDFFHLAGLHYLHDIKNYLRGPKDKLFRKIEKNEVLKNKIISSRDYSQIKGRLEILADLKNILNNTEYIHSYVRPYWSDINASYFIVSKAKKPPSYFFIESRDDGYYVGCSLFQDSRNFSNTGRNHKIFYKKFSLIEKE